MKKFITMVVCSVIVLMLAGCAVRQTDVVQDDSQNGELRIISTSAPLCTIMDKLDLDLVGVPETAFTIPERYKEATIVGAPMMPDFEIIKSLNPTDVLTPNVLQSDLQQHYQRIGVPSTFVNLLSLNGLFKSVEGLGEKYDREEQANALILEYEAYMSEIKEYLENKESPDVLILFGFPGMYMVATENSYVGSLVSIMGGTNVFEDSEPFVSVNTEELILKDPDIILRASHAMPDVVLAAFAQEFEENDIWKHFRAVQQGRVYDLEHNMFGMSANLNYKQGLEHLKGIFYDRD